MALPISITNPTPRDWALFSIYLVVFIDMMATALTIPVMPYYVTAVCGCVDGECSDHICAKLGGSAPSLGYLYSSFGIAQLLSNGWMGPLSDKIGRRKILTVTLGGAMVGMLGSSFAPSYLLLLASRVFIGACSGTMSACNAYIADITAPAERPALMANVGTLVQFCFMFGPGVGAGLAQMDKRAPFWVGAGTSLFALVMATVSLKPPEEVFSYEKKDDDGPSSAASKSPTSGSRTNWPLIGILAAGTLMMSIAGASLMTCNALFLQAIYGFGSLEYGFVMMYSAVVSILVRSFLFNRVQQSLGLMRTASVGCAMQTVCFAGYSLLPKVEPGGSVIGPSLYVYVAFSTLSAIGSAFSAAAVTPFFSQLANRSNMGRVMSIASMMNSAGRVVGPPLFGTLFALNVRVPYRVAAMCVCVGGVVYYSVQVLHTRATQPVKPLADADSLEGPAALARMPSIDVGFARLAEAVRLAAVSRGYDMRSPEVVAGLIEAIEAAMPPCCAEDGTLESGVASSALGSDDLERRARATAAGVHIMRASAAS